MQQKFKTIFIGLKMRYLDKAKLKEYLLSETNSSIVDLRRFINANILCGASYCNSIFLAQASMQLTKLKSKLKKFNKKDYDAYLLNDCFCLTPTQRQFDYFKKNDLNANGCFPFFEKCLVALINAPSCASEYNNRIIEYFKKFKIKEEKLSAYNDFCKCLCVIIGELVLVKRWLVYFINKQTSVIDVLIAKCESQRNIVINSLNNIHSIKPKIKNIVKTQNIHELVSLTNSLNKPLNLRASV